MDGVLVKSPSKNIRICRPEQGNLVGLSHNKKREHLEDVLLNLVDDDRIELPTSCL